jgi:hypothetical protein
MARPLSCARSSAGNVARFLLCDVINLQGRDHVLAELVLRVSSVLRRRRGTVSFPNPAVTEPTRSSIAVRPLPNLIPALSTKSHGVEVTEARRRSYFTDPIFDDHLNRYELGSVCSQTLFCEWVEFGILPKYIQENHHWMIATHKSFLTTHLLIAPFVE